jgi:hypothetical protein
MPKRGLSKGAFAFRETLRQAAKYNWEFKRRNEAYRLWWQQGRKANVKPQGWNQYFDPDISFDDLLKKSVQIATEKIQNPAFRRNISAKAWICEFLFLELIANKGVKSDLKSGLLTIKIDFNKINSVSQLRDYVSMIIEDSYIFCHKGDLLEGSKRSENSKRLNLNRDFKRILEAGDLERKGKTLRQIAKIIFGDENIRIDPEGAKIKAFELVKIYKNLVNGGYLDITYP